MVCFWCFVVFFLFLAIALGVVLGVRTHDARTAWPPTPGTDIKDPANWPNDYKKH